jgi:putative nucleotidyltransferase with HDIG domain
MDSQGKILIVDDEFSPRESLRMILKTRYECHTADSGDAALKFLRDNPTIDLVTLDLNMPGMGGLETLMRIKRLDPEMEAIIITGVGTVETLSKALQVGAFDHVAKPFNLVEINLLVRRAITRRRLREKFKTLFPAGTDVSQMITGFLNRRSRKDDVSFLDFVRVFSLTMQDKDPEMFSHVNRVTFFSMLLGDKFGFPSEEKENLQVGALLHDIGRLGVGPADAGSSEELNATQWKAFREHPLRGIEILEPLEVSPTILAIVRSHHERYDGSGFPDGLHGEEIPLAARIVSIANAYDDMAAGRRSLTPMAEAEVQIELKRGAGSAFDPLLVKAFLRILQSGGLVQLNQIFGSVLQPSRD